MHSDGEKWEAAKLLSVYSNAVASGPRQVRWSRRFLLDYPDDYTGDIPARSRYPARFVNSLQPAILGGTRG